MRKSKKRSRQLKVFLLFGLFLTLILILIVSAVGRREFNPVHKLALELVGSLQSGVAKFMAAGQGVWGGYVALWDVREENLRLEARLRQAQMDMVRYREAMATNVTLEKLLQLKESLSAPSVTAMIVGRDPAQWFNTVIINQGASDAVQQGMPVVDASGGVVGQVRNASPHYAKVLLANDPNSAVDALVQESRVQGVIKGNGKGFVLNYVLKNSEVKVGDRVVTSGLGGVFPKGQPVGTVSRVVRSQRGMFQFIEVEPAADFSRLEYLVVILNEKSLEE